jgi:hypothetical protein
MSQYYIKGGTSMKSLKKWLMIVSIAALSIVLVLGIIYIFNNDLDDSGVFLKIALSLATVSIACFYGLNTLNLYPIKKTLALISFAFIALSALMALIVFWTPLLEEGGDFVSVMGTLAVFSVLFNLIVSTNIKLGSAHKVLQWITYGVLFAIDLVITLQIWGADLFHDGFGKFFFSGCFIEIGLLITLAVLAKKNVDMTPEKDQIAPNRILVDATEYEALKKRVAELEAQLKNK